MRFQWHNEKLYLEEDLGTGLTLTSPHCSQNNRLKLKHELTKTYLKKNNKTNKFLKFLNTLNLMTQMTANNKIRRILLLECTGPLY